MAMTPAPLTDQQKSQLSEKRSANLKPMKQDNYIYLPNQPSGSLILMSGNLGI